MKKSYKSIFIFILISLSFILTSCKNSDANKKLEDTIVSEEDTNEKSIHIERISGKVNEEEYDYKFKDQDDVEEYTLIYSENFKIDKMEFIRLEFAENDLQETKILSTVDNIKKGEKVLINAVYPEGIPMLKIKWYADDNTIEDEYIIQYNGKDGIEDNLEIKY